MVMQSQSSGKYASMQKGVRHAPAELDPAQMSSDQSKGSKVKEPKDSETASNLLDDRTQEDPTNEGEAPEEDDLKFVLCSERYLIGHDIRGIV